MRNFPQIPRFLVVFFALLTGLNLWAQVASAVTLEFEGKRDWAIRRARLPLKGPKESVGNLTVRALTEMKAMRGLRDFNATESGVVSIEDMGNPVEVISDRKMKAYGWCYHFNGQEPAQMPDELFVTSDQDHIRWFWAYALYEDGEWKEMCIPARNTTPAEIDTDHSELESDFSFEIFEIQETKALQPQEPVVLSQGINLWQAVSWETSTRPEDAGRLERELDRLKNLGVTWVRILAGTQANTSVNSIHATYPACQTGPDDLGIVCAQALLRVLDKLQARQMQAIVVLSNFWNWSGGFPSYLEWVGKKPLPPIGAESGFFEMSHFFVRSTRFYSNQKANALYDQFVTTIVQSVPRQHPALKSWQLANEPSPFFNSSRLETWASEKFDLIRSLDPQTPISLGGVGDGPVGIGTKTDTLTLHSLRPYAYLTVHIWPENWGWYNPLRPEQTFEKAAKKSVRYLRQHAEIARQTGARLLLEEFGLARDSKVLTRGSTTFWRDRYFKILQDEMKALALAGYPVEGIAYWAWGGEGVPNSNLVGDPPHEPQGWYSIFDSDDSTLELMRAF